MHATRIGCVQVTTRSIRDGLNAVFRGLLTVHFERLKCEMNLTVLIGNFQDKLISNQAELLPNFYFDEVQSQFSNTRPSLRHLLSAPAIHFLTSAQNPPTNWDTLTAATIASPAQLQCYQISPKESHHNCNPLYS